MTEKSPIPEAPRTTAKVLDLTPRLAKQSNINNAEVVAKLKQALTRAESGAIVGALIVTIDKNGYWSTTLAGQMMYDKETLYQIATRITDVCMAKE